MNNKTFVVLEVQKFKKYYQVVFSNSDEVFKISEDLLIKFRILKGTSYSKEKFEEFKSSLLKQSILDKALKYVKYPKTSNEVINYLNQISNGTYNEEIIQYLIKLHYIDDLKYTNDCVEVLYNRGKGKNYIKAYLLNKGLPTELIEESLSKINNELEIAKKVATKYLNSLNYSVKVKKQKLSNKLYLSGFSYDIIMEVISSINFGDDSIELIFKEIKKLESKRLNKEEIIEHLLKKGFEYEKINLAIKSYYYDI